MLTYAEAQNEEEEAEEQATAFDRHDAHLSTGVCEREREEEIKTHNRSFIEVSRRIRVLCARISVVLYICLWS